MKEIIENSINIINNMSELFYQQKEHEALSYMNELLDNIMQISTYIDKEPDMAAEDKNKIVITLTEALNAMEAKDYVLLADILRYDMTDILEVYSNSL